MRKVFSLLVMFMLFSYSYSFNTINYTALKLSDCEEEAFEFVSAYEYYYGCLEADEYNWLYERYRDLCNNR